ncbi:hypothetical protein NXS19_006845 [Fusarium pseudograminearum]|nr:hypothetical protein NXS19_006845 [Fusarium pseudograminearum]
MNIPEDSLMPEYGDGINALRSFTPTKPETDSCRSLVNHIQVPEHQQPIPRKRDANADEEMSRVENSYRISTKRNIQALDERIENTENLMELCSNKLIEKQHGACNSQELKDARRRQNEAKQSLQALRDGMEDDRESYTQTLERIEILKEH